MANEAEDQRIDKYMAAGDKLRRTLGSGDALARLAIAEIADARIRAGEGGVKNSRRAYILNSLKHPDEVDFLRKIYGDALFVISTYAPKSERATFLARKIAKSRHDSNSDRYTDRAETLIAKDAKDSRDELGQNVRDTFPKADVFIRMGQREELRPALKRFVEILFNHPFRTPTREEFCMFHARAAALRSADLSRQVGAVVASEHGEILAVGCNEVPHAGGGSVWEGENNKGDYRDYREGEDYSAKMRRDIIEEALKALSNEGWLADKVAKDSAAELTKAALHGPKAFLRETRIASIIEFGRIVHAEMAAVCDAAMRGTSIKGGILYCTTFPCHMCARHLIAAGVKGVVYIEPYPKSVAKQLYSRSIRVEDDAADDNAVSFTPFVGIAPRRYLDFFEMPSRKDGYGKALSWDGSRCQPRVRAVSSARELLEIAILGEFRANGERWGIFPPTRRRRKKGMKR